MYKTKKKSGQKLEVITVMQVDGTTLLEILNLIDNCSIFQPSLCPPVQLQGWGLWLGLLYSGKFYGYSETIVCSSLIL
jgi:hypothetical protein